MCTKSHLNVETSNCISSQRFHLSAEAVNSFGVFFQCNRASQTPPPRSATGSCSFVFREINVSLEVRPGSKALQHFFPRWTSYPVRLASAAGGGGSRSRPFRCLFHLFQGCRKLRWQQRLTVLPPSTLHPSLQEQGEQKMDQAQGEDGHLVQTPRSQRLQL